MNIKKDITWRVGLCFLLLLGASICILAKAFVIQQVDGKYWRAMSDSLHQKIEEIDAERGTIYSEDGQMLSTSIPQFDIYIDFEADGLRKNKGKLFYQNIDSLSIGLSNLWKDKSAKDYKLLLTKGYKEKNRYYLLKKNVSFRTYQLLQKLPLVKLGRNKSGFIAEDKSIRLNPYKLLAYRTIGLDRENAQKIGLELTYDSILKGRTGKRLVRYIAGGVSVPIDEFEMEPESGKDIVTTLDIFIQEITENALMRMMVQNQAEQGTAIVMETKTGKIRAIANLGQNNNGNYFEDYNYAINTLEPGSTFKLATLIALVDDKNLQLTTPVNLEGGKWNINGGTVYDSEQHGRQTVTLQQAFELSSNVGMAKLVMEQYGNAPAQFLQQLHQFKLDSLTGIDLVGERMPTIHKPGSKMWSALSLPWMAFGYGIAISPMQTLMLYNAVANNGVMLKPYLLSAIKDDGKNIFTTTSTIIQQKICSPASLQAVKTCLEGVCERGTAKGLFKDLPYKVAGKTGTSLVAEGSKGYKTGHKVYLSSFAGYFPAETPQFTIVVFIKNRPGAPVFYGASVAGPVFKEISDRLYTAYVKHTGKFVQENKDSSRFQTVLNKTDYILLNSMLPNGNTLPNSAEWLQLNWQGNRLSSAPMQEENENLMPSLIGLNLKYALQKLETLGLKIEISGKGKIVQQSIPAGSPIASGQVVKIDLN